MIDEIKAASRHRLVTDGVNLSLRAVARDLGMAVSALYNYFESRDALVTALSLSLDAYDAIGPAVKEEITNTAGHLDRFLAVSLAVREFNDGARNALFVVTKPT